MKTFRLIAIYFFSGLFFTQLKANNGFVQKDTAINNELTPQEKAEGWQLLFDGKTLHGWRTFKNKPGGWKADDGKLCSFTSGSGNADLITDSTYKNFELSIDWKISPEGNSGILYLVTEDYDQTFLSGPEYQLIDDDGFPEKIEEWQKTGANYAMQPPSIKAANKPGEWNTTKIIVKNGKVEHWLNGREVVSYTLWNDEWKKEKTTGKWKDAPGYGASDTGHIGLQSSHSNVESSGICFRNIKIKRL
ncbi:DUF1080 domain-containing protein [Parafilimonas sp.]|uniref:3-keto-disaccharide hydrolase n=1 Tax=Parafilimonas sp. TaxID=1969739 RepID=UPI0039E5F51E